MTKYIIKHDTMNPHDDIEPAMTLNEVCQSLNRAAHYRQQMRRAHLVMVMLASLVASILWRLL